MTDELVDALRAAEQCMSDALEVYERGVSGVVMDEAMRSMKHDGLKKVRAALEAAQPPAASAGEAQRTKTPPQAICANCGLTYVQHKGKRIGGFCPSSATMWAPR